MESTYISQPTPSLSLSVPLFSLDEHTGHTSFQNSLGHVLKRDRLTSGSTEIGKEVTSQPGLCEILQKQQLWDTITKGTRVMTNEMAVTVCSIKLEKSL